MPPIRTAIAGTGFMGAAHAEALRRAGVHVAGILGSTLEKSRQAAASLGIDKPYASYEALLADRDVDAVHVTTPNHLHFPMVTAALEAGKHVMCEKPLAMTTNESSALVAAATRARARGLVTAVNYNIRFYPLCLEARARVQRGDVGAVHGVVGRYVQDWLLHPTDYNWRVRADVGGRLRAVADIGTHWLDLISTITGLHVTSVAADLSTVLPVRRKPRGEVETFSAKVNAAPADAREDVAVDTEDQGAVLLRFAGGARGSLWVSQMTAGRKNHLTYELSGARSALSWSSESPNDLWIGHRDRANEALIRDPGLATESARRFMTYPGGHNEGFPDTFKQCFRAFYQRVRDPEAQTDVPLADFADGHREIALCEAILRSHETRSWIDVAG
jgi:predicted dehydrogenase